MLRSILTLKYRLENALRDREEGAVMIEYALVVGLVSIVLIVGFLASGIAGGLQTFSGLISAKLGAISWP